ncbi:GtrA family protein [Streptomyces sp. NPDC052225]|uniref:GtrA family protein n=1 Tax=Streptomyces sp. NPDC052225 TaxID=3154949 RepID=UPI0034210C8B
MGGRHGGAPSALGRLYAEIAKFGVVGLLGIVVNLAAFNLLRWATDLQTVRASVAATAIAIVGNYIGFRYFTYRGQESGRSLRREAALFAFFSAVGLLIENGVLFGATYGLGLHDALWSNFFKFGGIGVATLFRFWSYRTWVFKSAPQVSVVVRHGYDAAGLVESVEETMTLRAVSLPSPPPRPGPGRVGRSAGT